MTGIVFGWLGLGIGIWVSANERTNPFVGALLVGVGSLRTNELTLSSGLCSFVRILRSHAKGDPCSSGPVSDSLRWSVGDGNRSGGSSGSSRPQVGSRSARSNHWICRGNKAKASILAQSTAADTSGPEGIGESESKRVVLVSAQASPLANERTKVSRLAPERLFVRSHRAGARRRRLRRPKPPAASDVRAKRRLTRDSHQGFSMPRGRLRRRAAAVKSKIVLGLWRGG